MDEVDINEFWINNPKILITDFREYIPNSDMSYPRQLNAVTRFVLYICLIGLILFRTCKFIFVGIGLIIIIIVMYKMHIKEHFTNVSAYNDTFCKPNEFKQVSPIVDIVKPNINNPYMNLSVNTISSGDKKYPQIDDYLYKEMDKLNNSTLLKNGIINTNDVYNANNSIRQFIVQPKSTHTNSYGSYLKFLYPDKNTNMCKEGTNHIKCTDTLSERYDSNLKIFN